MRLGRELAAGAVVSMAAVAGVAPLAMGQQVMVTRSEGPGGSGYTPVSARELEGYCRTLGFDEGQSEAAAMLLEGYREAVRGAQEERRSSTEQARLEFEDTRDHEALIEGMQRSTEKFRTRTEELEASFFGDLKSLTMDDQQGQWTRVERARRREREMDRGPVSTANVDVIELVDGARGSWRRSEAVRAILDRYEVQLDALLSERTRAGAALDEGPMGRFDPARLEAMNEAVEKQREVALRIRQLNDAVMSELLAQVAEGEERAALETAYERAKFPRVYREPYPSRLFAAAAGFDDLNEAQREAVRGLQSAYAAQAASLNGRWARELAEAEKSGEESSGGFVIRFGGEDEEESALAKASRARRELDKDMEGRLRDVLDGSQESRLPEREREVQEEWAGGWGEAVRIRGG
jgi:hypothetical protein